MGGGPSARMNKLRSLSIFVLALGLVPWLPLYVERTMTRASVVGHGGDVITYGWRLRALVGFWQDFGYMRAEQSPAVYLGFNLALALAYAAGATVAVRALLRRTSKA